MKYLKILSQSVAVISFLAPLQALAATSLADLSSDIYLLINANIIPTIFGLALVYFLWGLIGFLSDSGKKKIEARDHMMMGVIILAVMVSVWGLVNLVTTSVGLDNTKPVIPSF